MGGGGRRRGRGRGRGGGGRGEGEGGGGLLRPQPLHIVHLFEVIKMLAFPSHLIAVERGEVVEFDHVLPLSAEEPVGVAFSRAVGLQEG